MALGKCEKCGELVPRKYETCMGDCDGVMPLSDAEKIRRAKERIIGFGGIDGDHHKAWVIDQIFRILCGNDYADEVAKAKDGADGPDTYSWDEGIAP